MVLLFTLLWLGNRRLPFPYFSTFPAQFFFWLGRKLRGHTVVYHENRSVGWHGGEFFLGRKGETPPCLGFVRKRIFGGFSFVSFLWGKEIIINRWFFIRNFQRFFLLFFLDNFMSRFSRTEKYNFLFLIPIHFSFFITFLEKRKNFSPNTTILPLKNPICCWVEKKRWRRKKS